MFHLRHSLVDNGITTSFANDQVSPLYNDDRDEESSVAGVFQLLTVRVGLEDQIKEKYYVNNTVLPFPISYLFHTSSQQHQKFHT